MITTGFTGQLRGWWDNYLGDNDKAVIFNSVKQEGNNVIEDITATLIYAITKHFVGDPVNFQERVSEQLMNLRCPTMSDFRWYKDMFLTKLFLRPDCAQDFWKERFIAGLPKLFAERVRESLKTKLNTNTVPYSQISFGQLINFITMEGLNICNDLKLQSKVRKETSDNRRELGSFCQQYGFEKLQAPSSRHKKKRAIKHYFPK